MAKSTTQLPLLTEPFWPANGGIGNQNLLDRPSPPASRVDWRVPFKDQVTAPVVGGDGVIYVGGYDKNLYAFSPSGTLLMKDKLIGPVMTDLAIGASGLVFAAPHHRPPSGLETMLCAVDPSSAKKGRVMWSATFPGAVPGPLLPDREGGVVAVSSRAVVYSYDAEGRERFATKVGESDPSGATILTDGTIVAVSRGPDRGGKAGFLVTGLTPSGAVRFENPIPQTLSRATALADGGFWLFCSDGARLRFDAEGKLLASLPSLGERWVQSTSASVLPDGSLYAANGDRSAGALVVLDATGAVMGRVERGDGVPAAPLGLADGAALISVLDGTIVLVSATQAIVWSVAVGAPRNEYGGSIPVVPRPEGLVTRVDAAGASANAERQACELVGLV